MAIKCEVTQESGDLFFAHLLRVTLIGKRMKRRIQSM